MAYIFQSKSFLIADLGRMTSMRALWGSCKGFFVLSSRPKVWFVFRWTKQNKSNKFSLKKTFSSLRIVQSIFRIYFWTLGADVITNFRAKILLNNPLWKIGMKTHIDQYLGGFDKNELKLLCQLCQKKLRGSVRSISSETF